MAFNRLVIRRIPGLIQNLQNTSSAAYARKALPAILCCTNKVPTIGVNRGFAEDVKNAQQISWWQAVWGWCNKVANPPETIITEEERTEKEEFFKRLQKLYDDEPSNEQRIELFKEGFDILIKWDDWRGIDVLWNLAEEGHIVLDDETVDKVQNYLLEVRQRKYYQ